MRESNERSRWVWRVGDSLISNLDTVASRFRTSRMATPHNPPATWISAASVGSTYVVDWVQNGIRTGQRQHDCLSLPALVGFLRVWLKAEWQRPTNLRISRQT